MKKNLYLFSFLSIFMLSLGINAQETTPLIQSKLEGTVVDQITNEPIIGASINIKGTTHGVQTDLDGKFYFQTGQKYPYTLIISFLGYKTKELVVDGSPVRIPLSADVQELTDVLIVGYGTQKKKDYTGSLSSISAEIKTLPVLSVDRILQGGIPGAQVTQSSGQPGAGTSVRIRGGTSIIAGNEPLYVIDGFPVYNGDGATDSGVTSGPAINPLSSLNPSEIESIDVLKDASATAIYGSRGANGVILITTKRGKKSQFAVTYDGYYGVQKVISTIPMLNAEQWGYLKNDALMDSGKAPLYTQEQLDQLGEGTNWQEEAYTDAPIQSHTISITSGTEQTRLLFSGNYFKQDGVLINSGFDRYSGRLNIDHDLNSKFKLGLNLSGSKTHADVAPDGVVQNILAMVPVVPVRDANGQFTVNSSYGAAVANPIATMTQQINETSTTRFLLNGFGEYKIIEGLTAKVSLGTDIIENKQNRYIPSTLYESPAGGSASKGSLSSLNWLNENTISYKKKFGEKHAFDILAGYTQQKTTSEVFRAGSSNFASDEFTYNNLGSGTVITAPASSATEWSLQSYLARINYGFDDRYLFTFTARADGSSRFGSDNKWGTFPSGAFAWNVSNEKFLKGVEQISSLKLRLSAGLTGNQEINPYQSIARLSYYPYVFANTLVPGFAPNSFENSDLGWETTTQYNLGLDISLFNNRVNLTGDIYYKKTEDLLLEVPIPYSSGLESAFQNLGAVENKGIELALKTLNFTGDFEWTTNLIYSANRNKVLSLGNGTDFFIPVNPATTTTPSGIVKVGEPLGSFYMYKFDGLYQEGDDFSASPLANTKAGSQKFKDLNNDGKITQADDRTVVGNSEPIFLASLTNTFRYKNFDLVIFINSSYGNKIFNRSAADYELGTGFTGAYATLLNRWTPTNTNTNIHRAVEDPSAVLSDRYVEDGSYIRFKNISLGYTLPKKVATFLSLSSARVYIAGQNLITFTNYSGYDPEVNRNGQSALNSGVDVGVYLGTKTVLGGVSVTF
ncbi:SusC/RagA family TonB-linked outer membrane protein [Flavobacterium ajazii]|uniref:SusC/RagA family TonB-linked outer membrane protein n=1 Tax=Flavobacterium ajazii TaxID=2692318 RepID=UPI0013D34F1F|nr:TonB-dependent receptor [Flavobacterium ajazii]